MAMNFRLIRIVTLSALALAIAIVSAQAQSLNLDLGPAGGSTERALQLIALITVLSLAPAILVTVTSFTRIVVIMSILRSAIGLPSAPPNTVIISLSLFLTAFIMAPTAQESYRLGIAPLLAGQIEPEEAFYRGVAPLRTFMLSHVREKDLALFLDIAGETTLTEPEATPLTSLIPAFMISELRRAFEIGFLIFLPFLVIDLVIASILMAIGMMMLPPTTISLPFKLIFFVLVDGWGLIAGSIVKSYGS
ncbi:MAG: flagellar type III secretion system pore protein FliP [Hyphomicrobiales bacterium]